MHAAHAARQADHRGVDAKRLAVPLRLCAQEGPVELPGERRGMTRLREVDETAGRDEQELP
eukprot:3030177-Pyramimonas_sp.AAC.1